MTRQAADNEARQAQGQVLPLLGLTFAVKDNIDVAGVPTTAGCPDFAYTPTRAAPAVDRLLRAGAIFAGKTNLDQFATGLVGVRSPYGVPTNPFDERYIVGGSSSGSAAAVARGLVDFALGTDTAGSGRVPAGFTGLVGIKPSRGLISTTGVVPACRSLDCVSVFANTVARAAQVASIMTGFDATDAYSRPEAATFSWQDTAPPATRIAIPRASDLEFFGDNEAARAFTRACDKARAVGFELVEISLAPFLAAARLLYEGPFVAERLAGLEDFLTSHPESVLPITRGILQGAQPLRASETFRALHRLAELSQEVRPIFAGVAALLVPTAPTHYRIAEVAADPLGTNARLGRYTNFVNLLDLAAIAVPSGLRGDGLPTGVTFIAPFGHDPQLVSVGARFVGETIPCASPGLLQTELAVAVVGAHLRGQPLNGQLTDLGGRFVRSARTNADYRLYALTDQVPAKPGLVRVAPGTGGPIEIEIWKLPRNAFGTFFAQIKSPLGLGSLALDDGQTVAGFLCESIATASAPDITSCGGWRAYLSGPQLR